MEILNLVGGCSWGEENGQTPPQEGGHWSDGGNGLPRCLHLFCSFFFFFFKSTLSSFLAYFLSLYFSGFDI